MHFFLIAFLAFQSATVIYVLHDSWTIVGVQIGDVIYTAEFSAQEAGSFIDGERVQAEVKDKKLTVKRKSGKRVSARVIQVQRILIRPLP